VGESRTAREWIDLPRLREGQLILPMVAPISEKDLPASERRADRVPRGLKELIGEEWGRAASRESVRLGLGLVCAAQEALSLDALAGWARIGGESAQGRGPKIRHPVGDIAVWRCCAYPRCRYQT
jgi:hypothetical protein